MAKPAIRRLENRIQFAREKAWIGGWALRPTSGPNADQARDGKQEGPAHGCFSSPDSAGLGFAFGAFAGRGIASGLLAHDTKLPGFCLRKASTPAGVTFASVRYRSFKFGSVARLFSVASP